MHSLSLLHTTACFQHSCKEVVVPDYAYTWIPAQQAADDPTGSDKDNTALDIPLRQGPKLLCLSKKLLYMNKVYVYYWQLMEWEGIDIGQTY